MKPAVTTANKTADYLLENTSQHGDYLTNLKLQKLLYYSQGWHLALFNKPLFDDPIEAWIHGPAIPSVYRRFKRYTFLPITAKVEHTTLPKKTAELIDEVAQKYGRFTAWDLEIMTHRETPWLLARRGCHPDENSSKPLNITGITMFFKSQLIEHHEQKTTA
jgi:uncharacterized phage-associated protein